MSFWIDYYLHNKNVTLNVTADQRVFALRVKYSCFLCCTKLVKPYFKMINNYQNDQTALDSLENFYLILLGSILEKRWDLYDNNSSMNPKKITCAPAVLQT